MGKHIYDRTIETSVRYDISKEKQLELISAVEKIRDALLRLPTTFSCPSCQRFKNGWCSRYEAEVPKEHLHKGCEEWEDEISF